MAGRNFTRPENAISKSDEFMKVGKPTKALDTLYEVIKAKKHKHTTSEKLIESIMRKYLELCVDLKKSHVAKEGLYQYRNMCQTTNVASLTAVIQEYLNNAEKRTEAAKKESIDKVECDDLENLTTPEMIMLSAVSGEGVQDRADRTHLMPWVKFLWESYCQCLELLRTNPRVERLYHSIAAQAFKFCQKYQRKAEFRKLCEKLRNHLDLIAKQQHSTGNNMNMFINLNNPETQQLNMETRHNQLEAAIHMELWQEAYKAVEDIHNLMGISKKALQPKLMAQYYQKLALVFWKSGTQLFHAAAVFKYFQLVREMKKHLSQEELAKMASRVLSACLCVPLPSNHPEFDRFIETERTPAEKMARLASLLSLTTPPTRASLLRDCNRFGIVTLASPELQKLYNLMEVDFQPLKICKRVDDQLKEFEAATDHPLVQYCHMLREMTLVRLLKQVAQVYQGLKIDRLKELACFTTLHHLERVIVDCARNNDMQVRIDHRTGTVRFGTDLAEAQRKDLPEGPHVQSMPSEAIRTQLMRMMASLDGAINTIYPDRNQVENNELRERIIETYKKNKDRHHHDLLRRHEIIEKRKEEKERYHTERMKEKTRLHDLQEREKRKQEEARLKLAKEQRETKRREDEMKEIQMKQTADRIAQLKATSIGKKVLDKMDEEEIAKMDHEEIVAKQVEELNKEKKELQGRLRNQEKKLDHLERAKRVVEIPLLKEQWIQEEKLRIQREQEQRKSDMESKVRLEKMAEEKAIYEETLVQERKNIYEKKLQEFEVYFDEEKATRLEARRVARVEDRKRTWIREKEEEEMRRLEEEELRKQEEEERKLEEQRKKEEEEAMKRQAELDALEEKKRKKEMEIEERERAREEAERSNPRDRGGFGGADSGSKYRPPNREGGDSKWREREKRNEDRFAPTRRDDDRPPRRDDDGGGKWRAGNQGGHGASPRPSSPQRRGGSPQRRDGSPPARRGGGSPPRGDSDAVPWRRSGGGDGGGGGSFSDRRDERPRGGFGDDRRDDRPRGGGFGGPRRDDRGGGPRRDDRGEDRGGPRRDDRGGDRGGLRRDDRGAGGGENRNTESSWR